jgi:hypothetical protein
MMGMKCQDDLGVEGQGHKYAGPEDEGPSIDVIT